MNRNIPKFYICDEMQKLRDGLDERNIPWNDLTDKDDLWICRTHFWIKGDRWSVIHGFGSYGGFNSFEKDKQLLECKYGGNEPIGWLTADEVLKMVDEKRVHDCVGLIKGYMWSETPTSAPEEGAEE